MSLLKAQAKLGAIGGGEDKTDECRILKEFARLAGGAKAEIVLITAATDSPAETAAEYKNVFNASVSNERATSVSLNAPTRCSRKASKRSKKRPAYFLPAATSSIRPA